MVLAELAGGTLAGFGICAVGHPFDTIKVLMQMQPDKYTSMLAAGKETVATHGLSGLYRGVGAPLIGNGFYNAVQFAIFSRAKSWFTNGGADTALYRIAGAGAFTGIFVAMVEGPQDLLKSQVQAQMVAAKAAAPAAGGVAAKVAPRFTGVGDAAKAIFAERGVVGMTQGLPATVARNVVGVSAYFYGYEAVRKALASRGARRVEDLGFFEVMLAGGFGGLAYWVACYPLDIIKSAIQTDSIYPEARRYRGGVIATGQQLWLEGGAKRFTAGLAPCLARSFPANAAGFAIYETTMKWLK